MTYTEIKDKYPNFIYDRYEINEDNVKYTFTFFFEIEGLCKFNPSLEIEKKYVTNNNINESFLNDLVFHIGLIELISYWKSVMSKNIIIKCGYLDSNQISFFKKLYYYGLSEFLFRNNIDISFDNFVNITTSGKKISYNVDYSGKGNLIPIGGGKDSFVTSELLKDMNNTLFVINPKELHHVSVDAIGCDAIFVKRNLDSTLLDLNSKGYLNGHTPFSALVSFTSLLVAYLSGKKYVVLSNEASANESNIDDKYVNHQYSKSYEYEKDFNNYVKDNFKVDINYFSFLRPLLEVQIAKLFSKLEKYHDIFKSCNVGSKTEPWHWCCACPKCLFVYIILSPFLDQYRLINIFGEDLYDNKVLLNDFLMLLGKGEHKPFECVGTYEEVIYAVNMAIARHRGDLPYLLEYYHDTFTDNIDFDILKRYNEDNNLPEEFDKILRGVIND